MGGGSGGKITCCMLEHSLWAGSIRYQCWGGWVGTYLFSASEKTGIEINMGFSPALTGRNWWGRSESWRQKQDLSLCKLWLISDWNRISCEAMRRKTESPEDSTHAEDLSSISYCFHTVLVMSSLMASHVLGGFLSGHTHAHIVQTYVCI